MKRINIEENIENRIIDLIVESSEDRLVAFKPKGDAGSANVDLVVKKRGEYELPAVIKKSKGSIKIGRTFAVSPKDKSKELSFQINIFIGPGKTYTISKDIVKDNFIDNKYFYLMFIYFDEVKQDVSKIWLIPSLMFSEMAETIKLSEDKYTKFLIDKKELGNFLLERIGD